MRVKDTTKNYRLTTSSLFAEYKKMQFNVTDIKNYETKFLLIKMFWILIKKIKIKKYMDKRKIIRGQIGNNASFSKLE